INLQGARAMAKMENIVVALKMAVLVGFAVVGLIYLSPERLSPSHYPPFGSIFSSIAITFFAYEGFRIVTNTAEDMSDPARTLPRAIMTAILMVMVIYIGIALAVFGNLSPEHVIAAKDFALAEAAKPIFGETGFTVVAIAALFATASAINASLYAVTNVSYQLAKLGELPGAFAEPIAHSREGLVISSLFIACLAVFFDLSSIAAIGALSMLIIHATVHVGHLRLLKQTKASLWLVVLAGLTSATAVVIGGLHLGENSPGLLGWIVGFFAFSLAIELVLHRLSGRSIKTRTMADLADGPPAQSPARARS
ncbi:MAG TPA: amino acid permease, partial [Nannocystis exedens]|nr:amino acid permease [Nannocystis exedens]